MVDGWNAFFCEDLEELVGSAACPARRGVLCGRPASSGQMMKCVCVSEQRRLLSELQPNTESVGELWLGLLRFYTEEFDFKEHVISIRQRKRLTTFEKQWTSKCIAIEGAGLPPPLDRPTNHFSAHQPVSLRRSFRSQSQSWRWCFS